MGAGLTGGPLTGGPAAATSVVAPSGQSAIVVGPLGAGASDVVVKAGSSVADALINATAHVLSVRGGIGGSEVEYLWVDKAGGIHSGVAGTAKFLGASAGAVFVLVDDTNGVKLTANGFSAMMSAGGAFTAVTGGGNTATFQTSARLDFSGTDSTGTPGAATIDKPSGKSSIAIGAASVTITCNVVSAASRVMITPHARDATCKELIVVPGAGSFVVSGSANATAALPFSWEVSNLL